MRPGQSPEERLREALRARAAEVEPAPDALPRIRQRTAAARGFGLWAMVGAVAAVATAIAAGVVAVETTRGEHRTFPPAARISGTAEAPAPSTAPSTPAPAPPGSVNLPAYFTRNGRLYREFLPATADGDQARIRAAVLLSLQGRAKDPDYRSLWPDTVEVHGVTIDGSRVTVDLGGVGTAPADPPLAVQQLVYTVLAAATYTSMRHADGVRVLVDGAPVARLWGAVDTSGTLHQGTLAELQAPVWVIEPDQGAVVGKTFTVYLAGVVPEGTVDLRVRDAGGAIVDERVVQLSAGAPALGEARVQVTLPSGRYTVEAFLRSEKDGSVQWVDDHEFSVG
ncbi:Gmad2 immunoglobulin-like domain-containing protein [Dactylosporangium sp. NPDC049140]|uniref:Gmad2 immunoglobulin-like domain-containing protein n=1 Tax=Dactylosporangium sp. NPDC049140 TaxID=3155647 RepID=UPI0034028BA1